MVDNTVKEFYVKHPDDREMVLKKDIVIPAGTVFSRAPVKTERVGDQHFSHIIGLTNDSSGDLTYFIDPDDPALDEWFMERR